MNESAPSSLGNLAQVAIWLVVVVLVILASAWLVRRFGGGLLGGSQTIRVLSATSLGGRDRLALVQVGEQQLLLGVSPGRINALHVFDEPVVRVDEDGSGSHPPFSRYLQQRIQRSTANSASTPSQRNS
jgi:flagellar protein FliO/FliZ